MDVTRITLIVTLILWSSAAVKAQDRDTLAKKEVKPDTLNKKTDIPRLSFTTYGQVASGYVVQKEGGEGLPTNHLEASIQLRYFGRIYDPQIELWRPRDVNGFLRVGAGPMLTSDGNVPIWFTATSGITYNYNRTNISFGLIGFRNLSPVRSGGRAPAYLFGTTISLERINIPFFVNLLTAKEIHYIITCGFRIPLPLTDFFSPRQQR